MKEKRPDTWKFDLATTATANCPCNGSSSNKTQSSHFPYSVAAVTFTNRHHRQVLDWQSTKKQLNDSSDRFSSTSAKTFRQNTVTHTKHIKTSGLQASLLLLSAQHVEHSSSSQPKDYIWPYKAVQQTTIRYDYRHLLGPVHAACCRRNRPPSSAVALGGVRVVLV